MIIIAYKFGAEGPVQKIVTRTRRDADKIVEARALLRYRLWGNGGWYYTSFMAEGDHALQGASIEGPADVRVYA